MGKCVRETIPTHLCHDDKRLLNILWAHATLPRKVGHFVGQLAMALLQLYISPMQVTLIRLESRN